MIVQTEPATDRLPATWEHVADTGRPCGVWIGASRGKPDLVFHPADPVLDPDPDPDPDSDGEAVA